MPANAALYAPALWERARDDYLCGDTAAEVCARYGVSRSQFYAQARMGGWRKADQPVAEPLAFAGPPEPEPDDGAPAPPTADLAHEALRRGSRAMARGRLREAQGWVRLAGDLRGMAVEEGLGAAWGRMTRHAADSAALARVEPASPPAPAAEPTSQPLHDGLDAVLHAVDEVGRLAEKGSALLDGASGPEAEAAAEALLARADALLQAAEGVGRPDAQGDGPAWASALFPSPPTVCDAAPDRPDGHFDAPESGDPLPELPRFRGSDEGPEWPAYCRARATERPHQTFWISWAEMAEEKLAARAPHAPPPGELSPQASEGAQSAREAPSVGFAGGGGG